MFDFDQIKDTVKEFKRRQARFIEMTASELMSLSDPELFEAALARTEEKVCKFERFKDGVNALSHPERVFYAASLYEMEVNNGGLCQYFVNASRETAPFLADSLGEIDAEDHRKLFASFISENDIDVNDLSSFLIEDADDFPAQNERYPFDDFDNAFFALQPIQDHLAPYVRLHIAAF